MAAKAARDRLVRKVRSGLASAEEEARRSRTEAALTSATSARDGYLGTPARHRAGHGVRRAGGPGSTIWANRSWGFDPQYLAKNRGRPTVALRDARREEYSPSATRKRSSMLRPRATWPRSMPDLIIAAAR
jgi:hypothetical protein